MLHGKDFYTGLSNHFAFNVLTATRGNSYKLYDKTCRINDRHNFFVIVSSHCHFETFKSFKSFFLCKPQQYYYINCF